MKSKSPQLTTSPDFCASVTYVEAEHQAGR